MSDPALWIFAYGSLVWRPGFPHLERRPARIRGWTRRFWQGSIDHRGVPGAPGRVVTLLPEKQGSCWGMAYRVGAQRAACLEERSMDLESILSQLDLREQGGYERRDVELHFIRTEAPESSVSGLMYVATETNPNYLGPAALEQIACQVRSSRGPSGDNVEYVVRLAQSLREMGARDDHVFALEALLLGEVAK